MRVRFSCSTHFLKIALELGGCPPVLPSRLAVTEFSQRTAEPVVNVALVGQQVLRLLEEIDLLGGLRRYTGPRHGRDQYRPSDC